MPFIPNAEHIILELKRIFYGEPLKSAVRQRFNYRELSLEKQTDLFQKGIDKIFQSLEFDASAREDARFYLINLVQASYPVEHQTMTFGAFQRHILWEFLTHVYVPGLARMAAFWEMDTQSDIGMPDHKFWYLPELDEQNPAELILPVPQVLDWLMDLYGQSSFSMAESIDVSEDDQVDNIVRNLSRWRSGEHTLTKKSVDTNFSDDKSLDFKNIFQIFECDDLQVQFQKAKKFLKGKEATGTLSAKKLSFEFDPEGEDRIESLLNGNASDEYKEFFVKRVARRYSKPSAKTIRQRLHFARAVQNGYKRLLEHLCPEVTLTCPDPNKNRILELIEMFKKIYNLTVDAHVKCADLGPEAEDAYFKNSLPKYLAGTVYLSIAPQDILNGNANHSSLAEILSRRFLEMDKENQLTKYLPENQEDLIEIVSREQTILSKLAEENNAIYDLQTYKKNSLSVSEISKDTRFWLLYNISTDDSLEMNLRTSAAEQMRRLSNENSLEGLALFMQAMLARLEGQEKRVDLLLKEAEPLRTYGSFAIWDAPISFVKARHLLSKSKFDEAIKAYTFAWNASKAQPFGALRGEIAKELLILKAQQNKFNRKNDRSLVRDMTYYGQATGASYKEASLKRELSIYWHDIYRPYGEQVSGS